MRRVGLVIVGIGALIFAAAQGFRAPSSPLPQLTPALAWKDVAPHIQLALTRSNEFAEKQIAPDIETWVDTLMSKAAAKGGFLDGELNYWHSRLAGIKWGWNWLTTLGDRAAADQIHQEEIARRFSESVATPEQIERDLTALSDQKAKYFISTLGGELDAIRIASGAPTEMFNSRLSSVVLTSGSTPDSTITLASIVGREGQETASRQLLENSRASIERPGLTPKIEDAIKVIIKAVGAGTSLALALKTAGVASKVAVSAGCAAAVVLAAAAAYDQFQHHNTYEARREKLRREIEAGLRTFGHEVLKTYATATLEAVTFRVISQLRNQAI